MSNVVSMYRGPLKPAWVNFDGEEIELNISAFFGFKECKIDYGVVTDDRLEFRFEVVPYDGDGLGSREEIGKMIANMYNSWFINYSFGGVYDLILFLLGIHMEQSEIYWDEKKDNG